MSNINFINNKNSSSASINTISKNYRLAILLLGRNPKVNFTIKTYCQNSNTPQVLEAQPIFIEDNLIKPFPTIFWLVCSYLRKEVSKLESQGYIKKLSKILQYDDKIKKSYIHSQKIIANYRIDKAKQILNNNLPPNLENVLLSKNIAGSSDLFNIKCLHAHFAHYLATRMNPLGELIYQEIGDCNSFHDELVSLLGEE